MPYTGFDNTVCLSHMKRKSEGNFIVKHIKFKVFLISSWSFSSKESYCRFFFWKPQRFVLYHLGKPISIYILYILEVILYSILSYYCFAPKAVLYKIFTTEKHIAICSTSFGTLVYKTSFKWMDVKIKKTFIKQQHLDNCQNTIEDNSRCSKYL